MPSRAAIPIRPAPAEPEDERNNAARRISLAFRRSSVAPRALANVKNAAQSQSPKKKQGGSSALRSDVDAMEGHEMLAHTLSKSEQFRSLTEEDI